MSAQPDFNQNPTEASEMFPQLDIPHTLAAGPGPGNTDARVLEAYARAGVAELIELAFGIMLRDVRRPHD